MNLEIILKNIDLKMYILKKIITFANGLLVKK
jgi:hypothetical protein